MLGQELGPLGGLPVFLLGQWVDRADAVHARLQSLSGRSEGLTRLPDDVGLGELPRGKVPAAEFGQLVPTLLHAVGQMGHCHLHLNHPLGLGGQGALHLRLSHPMRAEQLAEAVALEP